MASTYTSRIRLEKQGDGENPNSWGLIMNQNVIDLVDEAVAGYAVVSVSSIGVSLTTNNGSTDEARNAALEIAGTLTADVTITIPSQEKTYFIRENTTGSFVTKIKTVGGSAVELTQGTNVMVACDGTEIYKVEAPTSVSVFTANTFTATSISTSILSSTDITTSIVSATSGFIGTLSATNITATSAVSFVETSAGASNTVSLIAPASITSNYTLTLPSEDGTANKALTTDGSGNLSFNSMYPQSIVVQTGGDYTIPATAQAIFIKASGGGGGGEGVQATQSDALGPGGNGGDTTVTNSTLSIAITAKGGYGGGVSTSPQSGSTGGIVRTRQGSYGGIGGHAATGFDNFTGRNGQEATAVQKYITGTNIGGETLTISYGAAGAGNTSKTSAGGDGGAGYVEIWVW